MVILALDLAKSTGWAIGGDEIISGTAKFTETDIGELAISFMIWLESMLDSHLPELVAYEAPVVKHPHAAKILIGLSWLVILACRERKIPCIPVGNTAVKRHFLGRVYGKKVRPYPGIIEARRRGFDPTTTDEADAIAILLYVRDHHTLKSRSRATSDRKSAGRKRHLPRDIGSS
jgi:Holliday junction resolvasome RuvABC endonuclease subunit